MTAKHGLLIFFICVIVFGNPSKYSIKKLPPGMAITIDGNIDEWNESFFIDSLRSDDNVYARHQTTPWTPADFQYKLYLACSSMPTADGHDTGYVYGMAIVTRDPDYIVRTTGWVGSGDNMMIHPGGQAQTFYISSDGSLPVINPSSPYQVNKTLFARCKTYGNLPDSLPTYEFALRLDVTNPFYASEWQASFGSEEIKTGSKNIFCAVGAEYTGFKQPWIAADFPAYNSTYHPTFFLSDSFGSYIEKQPNHKFKSETNLHEATPNPFNPSTKINFTLPNISSNEFSINIYDIRGKTIRTLLNHPVTPGNHTIIFDGKNDLGQSLTSGIYFCRMKANGYCKTIKLVMKE